MRSTLPQKSGGFFISKSKKEEPYMARANQQTAPVRENNVHIQEFLDMISPSVIRFYTDYFVCRNTFRCV
jgi:hypothetical protein